MKVSVLKTEKRYDSIANRSLGIQTYGEKNDYPQLIMEVVAASVTGGSCVSRYSDFISGKGFANKDTYQIVVNGDGETVDHMLQLVSLDYAQFGGFAFHVNYNANYQITSIHHVPFESARLSKPNEITGKVSHILLHPDWGRRFTALRKWRKEDIDTLFFYDPNPLEIERQMQEVGGWSNYKGQVFYYSNKGKKVYPLPIFDSALTDMSTEEAVSDITNRNANNGFLPAGMFVEILEDSGIDKEDEGKNDVSDVEKSIIAWQGSKNACKVGYAAVKSKEEIPIFVKMAGTNYDKEFTVSRDSSKDNIGRSFNQPPILRAENVGSGFGAELMEQAYNYYNSVTENERLNLERVFVEFFKHWQVQVDLNFEIEPLSFEVKANNVSQIPTEILSTLTTNEKRSLIGFSDLESTADDKSLLAEKIGIGGTQSLVEITTNPELNNEQKRGMLKVLFALTDDQINLIIPLL